ncbi:hypothetical protein LR48_Vigan153s000400 [Vigna angularis]|nr:uncharacterized protein LOC108319211 [Vigna angularis]KOM25682.1 hypothetical protein LR48_Vigan153s000400 [Vigna angularis]
MLLDIDLNAPYENSHSLQTVTPVINGNKPLPNHETQHGSNNQVHAKFPTFPLDIDLNIPYNEASMVDSKEDATQHDSNHGGNKEELLTKVTDFDLNIPYIDSTVNDNEASNKGLINGGTQHVSNNGANEEDRDKFIQGRANLSFMPIDIDLNTSYVDNEASVMDE